MSLTDSLKAVIESSLSKDEREHAVVYVDDRVLSPGTFTLGDRECQIDYPYVTVFIDGAPGRNWMHSCRYLLIHPDGDAVTSIDSDRPPLFGILPSSWRVLICPAGLEEWKLIPIEVPPKPQTT